MTIARRLWALRRDAAGAAVHWSGLGRLFEIAAQPAGAIILMYHSVAQGDAARFIEPAMHLPTRAFDRQMEFLSRCRRVVPMSRLVETIESGGTPPAGTVCLTFDDGYLDNLAVVAPILQRYRLPATLYLPTRYIELGEAQWADRLHWLLEYRASEALSIPSLGLNTAQLRSATGRAAVRKLLHGRLLECDYEERTRILQEMEEQLRPFEPLPKLTMNWDDVRELCRRYPFFEIGGHTRDHVDLRRHRGETARAQIEGCAADLQRELGQQPRHFSFPYERWCAETRDQVAARGWRSAVGAGDAYRIGAGSDRFAMPRVESPRSMTELRFKTSGAYPGALAPLGLA